MTTPRTLRDGGGLQGVLCRVAAAAWLGWFPAIGTAGDLACRTAMPADAGSEARPSAYPADPQAWPGVGPVRVFPWMAPARERFWARRMQDRASVVFAGDSLIDGWAGLTADFAGLRVANRGIGGDTSRGLLFRWQQDVLSLSPRAIVLLVGTNDLSALAPPEDIVQNIRCMLSLVRIATPALPVVLCTLPPRRDPRAPIDQRRLLELNQGLSQLAAQTDHVQLVDLHARLVDDDGAPRADAFADDRLHLAPAGYRVVREAVAQALRQAGVYP